MLTRGLNDPRMTGSMVTVTEVDLAKDGRDATVHVSVLPEKHEARCVAAIKHASGHIRRQSGELIRMRALPQLHFVLDQRLKKQAGVIAALGQLHQDEARKGVKGPDVGGQGAERPDAGAPDVGSSDAIPGGTAGVDA